MPFRDLTWDESLNTEIVNVKKYGAVGSGIIDDRTAINTAQTAAGVGKVVYFPSGTYKISSNITISSNMIFANGAKLSIDNTMAVTITGAINAPLQQIFSGVGTVSFAGNAKLKEVYPQWWGATGDGITDDTAAMQAAITATNTVGGTVFISTGTYILSTITMKNNISIIGGGRNSILKLKANTNADLLYSNNSTNVSNIRISNLAINGNKANNTSGSGIAFGGTNIVVEGCYIYDVANAGICIGNSTGNGGKIRILNNWVHNPALSGNYWGAIAVTSGDDVIIFGNIAAESDTFMNYGIDVEPNADCAVSNVTISNNIMYDGQLTVNGTAGTVTDVRIIGNAVRATTAAGAPAGMKLSNILGKLIVSNNDIEGPAHTNNCLEITLSVGALITGNRIKNNSTTTYAMYLSVTDSLISNNYLWAVTQSDYGIYEYGSGRNTYFGNQFYQIGIPYNSIASPVGVRIKGHVFFDEEVDNGNSSTADTINWTAGNKQKSTLTDSPCVYTFTPPTGPCNLTLRLIQDGTGSRLVTWPNTVKWAGGVAPALSTAINAVDIVNFYWNGTYYYGTALLAFN